MQAAVNYCLVIASLGIYLCISARFYGKVFVQAAIMAIGVLIPIVTNFLYLSGLVDLIHDPTVMALSASTLLFLVAIYWVDLFSLSPYSLQDQLDTDGDGLGLLKTKLKIVDADIEFIHCLKKDSTTFTVKEEHKPDSWFRVSSHLVRTNRGRVRGVGVRLRDISDLFKHAETISEQATERLQMEEELQCASLKTTALTKQLMTFAKGGVPVKETASVKTIVTETVNMSLQGTRTKPIYDFAEGLHYIDADADQIGQIIQNLTLNASESMQGDGLLEIAVDNIVVNDTELIDPGEYVRIRVSDNGNGMTDDLVKHVFEPYFSTKEVGHGLGLSISYSIAQRHGGTMSVRPTHGHGTEFTILLSASHGALPIKIEEKPGVSKGSGRVLMIDDEQIIHESLSRMMKALGYEVSGTMDGKEGLRVYLEAMNSDDAFSMVILDLTLPGGMVGSETIVKLKELNPLVKAIVSSGYSNDEVMANYEAYGFCGRISKPIRLVTLSEELKRVTEL
jgi:signal transduction histidine kinase/CheY-like chemotaxis protein